MSPDTRRNPDGERYLLVEGLPFVLADELVAAHGDTYLIRKDAFDDIYVLTEEDEE